jgi:hypothetical protein
MTDVTGIVPFSAADSDCGRADVVEVGVRRDTQDTGAEQSTKSGSAVVLGVARPLPVLTAERTIYEMRRKSMIELIFYCVLD